MGRPALHRLAVVATAVAILLAIYPACRFLGPVGGQIAALSAVIVGYIVQLKCLRSVTGLSLLHYGGTFVLPVMGAGGMLAIVLGSRRLGLATNPVTDIALCVGSCLAAYVVCASVHLRTSRIHNGLYAPRPPESAIAL
jgi:hypothetical protein